MSISQSNPYQTQSAVLFVVFNRPDTTRRVFEEIRQAQPPRLYIAADGPRKDREGEEERCMEARQIAQAIDWPCQVFTLFRATNMGCKDAVSSAVTWFFENEEEGIILEDDCLPDNSFFHFCDTLLALYRTDTRVSIISGCNLQYGQKYGTATYYFSNLTHIWGWASWRRVWKDYDKELARYDTEQVKLALPKIFAEPLVNETWLHIFKELKAGKIDTWDYQLTFLDFFNNRLSIIPNQNLICNIGFGEGATHTLSAENPNSNIPLQPLTGAITHPLFILPQKDADSRTLFQDFDVEKRKRRNKRLSARIKRWWKSAKS
ncbi:hypothetical protein C8P68_10298 [Mucilaginibacter yixingensis]|uniref:Nucleotide-diphospho-sugar transferase n=1 Tax=Mucilaginibacter yixingensis TaxID=1295612 RepID=A0A2T5JBX7_9SPHI|nr:nucleotide-diphospho-sugar transferase [Mucilaginibacter yixingensis]PTQ99282.1 hypothetical protein C8P68_10298 [Mucilaginibacter yixingensis]